LVLLKQALDLYSTRQSESRQRLGAIPRIVRWVEKDIALREMKGAAR
jgi:hypothetical protein